MSAQNTATALLRARGVLSRRPLRPNTSSVATRPAVMDSPYTSEAAQVSVRPATTEGNPYPIMLSSARFTA